MTISQRMDPIIIASLEKAVFEAESSKYRLSCFEIRIVSTAAVFTSRASMPAFAANALTAMFFHKDYFCILYALNLSSMLSILGEPPKQG